MFPRTNRVLEFCFQAMSPCLDVPTENSSHVTRDLFYKSLKVELVNRLQRAGCKYIEVGAFVSPKAVPRMADSSDVFKLIDRTDGITYAALTPNLKGFEGAIQVQANEVAIFTAASEGKNFPRKISPEIPRF